MIFLVCSFEGIYLLNKAQWLSWLERRPVTAEVESSSLFWVVLWDLSSAGRASALQAEGHRFEPYWSHLNNKDGFPSGQRGQTVNLLATPSKVRILLHPLADMILGIGQRRLLSLHCMLTKGIGTHRT